MSTTRTHGSDRSGDTMEGCLKAGGHRVLARRLVRDDRDAIRACLSELAAIPELRAILLTGGSGITRADVSVEAVAPFVQVALPGFGELFRSLSYAEIGSAAMLSRAMAAVCRIPPSESRLLVAVLPGSPEAVRLGLERLLIPELGHVIYEIDRD